ncbi:hypothetical protein KR067_008535 [Drosophila pandora]|nr:hypothetical protein KR067_008535 [Drosophila pandora]
MFFLRAFRGFGDSCEVAPIETVVSSPARAPKKARVPKKAVKKASGGSAKKSLKGKPSVKASKKLVVKNARSRANGKPKAAAKKPKKLVKRKPVENEAAPVVQDLKFFGESSDDTFHDVPSLTAILGRTLDTHIETEPGKQPRARQSSEAKKGRSSAGKRKEGSSKGESKRKGSAKTERLVGTRKQIQGKWGKNST